MKKFIGKTVLFCLIIISILYLLDYTATKGLRKSHFHTFNNLTKIYNSELNSDLIINGSSIALFQISPFLIDSILNVNSYNFGIAGAGFIDQKLQYDLYLKYNKKPKTVIQLVGDFDMFKNEKISGNMAFTPYLDMDMVKKVAKKYKGISFLDYNIPFFKYTGSPFNIMDGFFSFFGLELRKPTGYKGYFEQDIKWTDSFDKFTSTHKNGTVIKMDAETMKIFENYIAECKKNKINILLIYPPTYYKYNKYIKNQDDIISYYTSISKKYDVPFIDYSTNFLVYSTDYFYNSQHLNKKGAEIFTKILGEDIKKILPK
ncbi:hypothetical protein MPF19_09500 [Polaribacter sp. Z014]|uniref:hypothetical protein n=1 Tax=Polaribacter sp. Z014 TaxID=2927126 RepID=UPI002021C485|nr:hypothetical protein [Polaribacter sp. Z014]MCL7763648.1 hypothetical protein [Polaribacter sp. Z014]